MENIIFSMENHTTTVITLILLLSLNCRLAVENQKDACQECIDIMKLICGHEASIVAADCAKSAILNYHVGVNAPKIIHDYFQVYMFNNIVKEDQLKNPKEYCSDILKKDAVLTSDKIKSNRYKKCLNDLTFFPDGAGLVRYAFFHTSTLINPSNMNEKRYLEHIANNIVLKFAIVGPINYCLLRYPFDQNQDQEQDNILV